MASIGSIINAAGQISNILFDLSPKSFYSIRDFYNFIKKRQNTPMMRKHFTVVPYCEIYLNGNNQPIPEIWNTLFNDANLAKFAILIQSIRFSPFGIQSEDGRTIKNLYGKYAIQGNGYSGMSGDTINMQFLQTADPIIEHMILPWYYQCMRTFIYTADSNKKSFFQNAVDTLRNGVTLQNLLGNLKNTTTSKYRTVIPKLTLDIKYYRMDQIAGLQFLMNPVFVYRLTGVYPTQITPVNVEHGQSAGSLKRQVTFKYNNFICIPNGEYQQQMFGNVRNGFAYKNMSPIQILNALNSTADGAIKAVNIIRNI